MKYSVILFSLFFFDSFITMGQVKAQDILETCLGNPRVIDSIYSSTDLSANENLYFLKNNFFENVTDKFSDKVKLHSENYYKENLISSIFYIKNMVVDTKLAFIDIAYNKHFLITVHLRKLDSNINDWKVFSYSFNKSFSRRNSAYTDLANKIYHFGRDLNDENIIRIKKGMTKEEVNKIMKKTFYNRIIRSNEELVDGDTLKAYKYTSRIQPKAINIIYFDDNNKVDSLSIAKEKL